MGGVPRTEANTPANLIYRKLRDSGYRIFPVNPKAEAAEGDLCYPDLQSIPETPDGLVVVTPPDVSERIVRQCTEVGVSRVWINSSFGAGSVSDAATRLCHEEGISVIAGSCPMMYCPLVDLATNAYAGC